MFFANTGTEMAARNGFREQCSSESYSCSFVALGVL
jgi:hypothetical protein